MGKPSGNPGRKKEVGSHPHPPSIWPGGITEDTWTAFPCHVLADSDKRLLHGAVLAFQWSSPPEARYLLLRQSSGLLASTCEGGTHPRNQAGGRAIHHSSFINARLLVTPKYLVTATHTRSYSCLCWVTRFYRKTSHWPSGWLGLPPSSGWSLGWDPVARALPCHIFTCTSSERCPRGLGGDGLMIDDKPMVGVKQV